MAFSNSVNIFVMDANLKNRSNSAIYKDLEIMNMNAVIKKRKNTDKSEQAKEAASNHFFHTQNEMKQKRNNDVLSQYNSFQKAMKILFLLGQIVSLNPQIGISEKGVSRKSLTHYWMRYLYSILICAYQFLTILLCLYDLLIGDLHMHKIAIICYYIGKFFNCILFIRLVPRWPHVMQYLSQSGLDEYVDPYIHRKVYAVSIICVVAVYVNHLLSVIAVVTKTLDCSVEGDIFEIYTKDTFGFISSSGIPYHTVLGIFLQVMFTITVLLWNYSDLFVMCISLYLSSIFNQINKKMRKANGQAAPPSFWRSLREDYSKASCLVQIFDEAINGIVFSSFANNLLFVCLQLYYLLTNGLRVKREILSKECPYYPSGILESNAVIWSPHEAKYILMLEKLQRKFLRHLYYRMYGCHIGYPVILSQEWPFNGYEHVIYFSFAFLFSIVRSIAVCLITAKVNVSSMTAAPTLFNVPSTAYCDEVQRFIEHVYGDTIALTGMNYFYVTKPLLITIAGTVITYELVLIQIKGSVIIKY